MKLPSNKAGLPGALAMASRYGPDATQGIQRSQYLTQALQEMASTGASNGIHDRGLSGLGEVAAKLGAVALLKKGEKKASREALAAVAADQSARASKMVASLGGGPLGGPPAAPAPTMPQMQAPAPQMAPQAPQQQPQMQPMSGPTQISPQDLQSLALMGATEAGGEGTRGIAAAQHVALNRLKRGWGGAKSLSDVVWAPKQFTGMANAAHANPQAVEHAKQVAMAVLSGQIPDETNGAIHFINPELQAQNGDPQPAWAPPGGGMRIGRHVFYGDGHNLSGEPQAFQVAQQAPPLAGGVPSAQPGQPGAPNPAPQQQGAPGASTWSPSHEQVDGLKALFESGDPDDYQMAVGIYQSWRAKMLEPQKWDTVQANGLPIQVDPTTGQTRGVQIPDQYKTQAMSGAQAGIPGAPGGMSVDVNPTGDRKAIYTPPTGYEVPNGGNTLQPQAGGPAQVQNETQIRQDFEKDPDYRAYNKSVSIFNSLKQSYGDKSRISDLNFVYGMATIFDPTSVVREGEQVMIKNAQNLPDWLVGQINRVNGGQGIADTTRQQILQTAGTRVSALNQQMQVRQQYNSGLATRMGLDPRNVMPPLMPFQPWSPGDGAPPDPHGRWTPQQQAASQQYKGSKGHPGSAENPILVRSPQEAARMQPGTHIILPDGSPGRVPGR